MDSLFLLSYVLSILYRRREKIIKVPVGTDREVRIYVTSTMAFNVDGVAYYLRSLPSLSPTQQLLRKTHKSHGQRTHQRQHKHKLICSRSNRYNHSSNKIPRESYSSSTNTNSSKLPERLFLCISCGLPIITKCRGIERSVCTLCTSKRPDAHQSTLDAARSAPRLHYTV